MIVLTIEHEHECTALIGGSFYPGTQGTLAFFWQFTEDLLIRNNMLHVSCS